MGDPELQIKPELYRVPDVCAVLGVSRSTVYKLVETDPSFPRQVRVTSRAVRWRRLDIEEWARTRPRTREQRPVRRPTAASSPISESAE